MGEDFRVVIGGPCDEAYDAQLRAYARQVKMEDRTTFLGMVPAALKPSLYEACDLFVLPTSMENFGFVYFESLSCQTPLVTTRGTDTWKELEASGGARIVDRIRSDVKDGEAGGGDVEELARTIGGLIRERGGLKPMGRAGRAWVLENLEPSKIVARFIAMYERAIKGGPADSRPSRNSSDA
jgi:glycosyltransferase involved in cell wall biosynthesis